MWVAGVDGCRVGWVAVFLSTNKDEPRCKIFRTFDEILAPHHCLGIKQKPKLVAVDIPIGLPRKSVQGGRLADREARKFLGGTRQSSVFPAPCRAVLEATSFEDACDLEEQNSEPPKKVNQQVFLIQKKIAEVDTIARRQKGVFECHPEVTFCVMNNNVAMLHPKKRKVGREERRELLKNNNFPKEFLDRRIGSAAECKWDDQLDACAAAWTARRILEKRQSVIRFPKKEDLDGCGLDMAIWA